MLDSPVLPDTYKFLLRALALTTSAALTLTLDLVPLAALLLILRMRARPWPLLEAAADLGAGWWTRLWLVDWPHLRPALAVVWVWSALQVLGDTVALEIAGGGKVYGPGLLIRDALIHDGAPARALLGILVLLAAAVPCAMALGRELALAARPTQEQRPASPRWRLAGALLWLTLLAVPSTALLGPHPEGVSGHDRVLADLLGQTLGLAAVVAVLAVLGGFAAGLALRGRSLAQGSAGRWITAALLLPVAVPDSIYGLLSLNAASQLGLGPGSALTVLALLPAALALALLVARVSASTIPDVLLEAAADLGADWWQRLRWVWLPLARPALLVALLLVAAWVLGQATIPSFTSGPGGDTLAVGLTVLARGGAWPVVRRWSLALIVLPTISVLAIHGLSPRRRS
ncbi:MAG: ABC transporter permease subunit [Myxococcales bacterium]|nr:ABC transporter permease subunit [Myxococcales bacterium]